MASRNPDSLIVKCREKSGLMHGKNPSERTIEGHMQNGIINIDKPAGPTSYQVVEFVKNILKIDKVGHAGTLDPGVSGVLVVGINNGTKVLTALLAAPKEYVCLMHLHEPPATSHMLQAVLAEFTGKIFQTPPVKAAVKRELRIREIYSIDLLEISGKDVLFRVLCESGTYVRRLCHDIGLVLGTGAHMQQLRRTKTGSFDEFSLTTLHDLADAYAYWKEDGNEKQLRKLVQPLESGLAHLPKIVISDNAVNPLAHGAQLAVPGVLELSASIRRGDLVGVFTQKGEAVILGKSLMDSGEILEAKKGVAVKTERVLIEPGVYQKIKHTK